MEANNADKKELIIIPFTRSETQYNKIPLITNVNKPKVKRFIGKVINRRTGFINTFIIPNKAEAIMIEVTVSAENPVITTEAI